jgi:hypothetical protein
MQATLPTPLPEMRLFDRYQRETRLLFTDLPHDWDRYDMAEVVHHPSNMEPKQLSETFYKLN